MKRSRIFLHQIHNQKQQESSKYRVTEGTQNQFCCGPTFHYDDHCGQTYHDYDHCGPTYHNDGELLSELNKAATIAALKQNHGLFLL